MRVADLAASAAKFGARGVAASGDYKTGVSGAGAEWSRRTGESEENWSQGVNAAIARGAFKKGVDKAGSEKYVRNATQIGAARYGQGVQAATGDWQKGFQPYAQRLASLELPPKGPKGDPRNYQRSQVVGQALRDAKVGQ